MTSMRRKFRCPSRLLPHAVLLIGLAACSSGGGGDDGDCGSVDTIGANESVSGSLATSDCSAEELFPGTGDTSLVDQYRVTLPSAGTLRISMESSEFDPFLALLDTSLSLPPIAVDDDGGGGLNALITIDLAAGTYIIFANSAFAMPDTGAYELSTSFP